MKLNAMLFHFQLSLASSPRGWEKSRRLVISPCFRPSWPWEKSVICFGAHPSLYDFIKAFEGAMYFTLDVSFPFS